MSVVIENLHLSYGRGKSAAVALNGVSLRVEPRSIYGLLGPSGCGKTSILLCLLGIQQPRSGAVKVLGDSAPGSPGLGIPGPNVGYMPQMYSLHSYFTAVEILTYYGRVFGVEGLEVKVRRILERLDLWDGKVERRQLTKLSGGQRRRISLACALIHQPKIVVLDEPTVGVDPVLRLEIWKMLNTLTSQGTTIVITTHYMEEASKADKIGFVRSGRVLREGSPTALKESFGLDCLDDVFFRLCFEDSDGDLKNYQDLPENRRRPSSIDGGDVVVNSGEKVSLLQQDSSSASQDFEKTNNFSIFRNSFSALLYKNLIVLKRHRMFMLFQTILPVVTLLIFLACVGQPLRSLRLAVINEEDIDCRHKANLSCARTDAASSFLSFSETKTGEEILSCHILDQLDDFVFSDLVFHDSYESAKQSVVEGRSHAMISVEKDFSAAFWKRMEVALTASGNISSEDLSASLLKVKIDATNYEVARTVKVNLVLGVHDFFVDYVRSCNLTGISETLGLTFTLLHPQQQRAIENLAHAILPAMVPLVLNMLAMALTADVLVTEKQSGILTRDFVCGVPLTAVLLAQIVVFLLIVGCQILFSLSLVIVVFPFLPTQVVIFLVLVFLLQSVCGMTQGYILTALFKGRHQVIQAGSVYVFPAFVLSGVVWPRVTMPYVLQVVALLLPTTISCDVAREIVLNQDLHVDNLGLALVIPLVWGFVCFTLSVLVMRYWGGAGSGKD